MTMSEKEPTKEEEVVLPSAPPLEVPEFNQIELHPWCQKNELVSFLRDKNIKIVAYSSLVPLEGWREKPNQDSAKSQRMKEIGADNSSPFKRMSAKYGVSEAQILLKWGLQMGYVILPKSSDEGRIRENFDLSYHSRVAYQYPSNLKYLPKYHY